MWVLAVNWKILLAATFLLIPCFSMPGAVAFDRNTDENQYQIHQVQEKLVHDATPYLLPQNHPLKPILDSIFPTRDIIRNEKALSSTGFIILRAQKQSGVLLIKHPLLEGYIIKLYLDSQQHHRKSYSQQDWLVQRCRGAAQLRKIIATRHFDHFTVPDKWLYELPPKAGALGSHTYAVVATYMHLVNKKDTHKAWKEKATKKDLRELFFLMKHGGASGALVLNTPYTVESKFTFIDTEYPDRFFKKKKLAKVAHYFSHENQRYWFFLLRKYGGC